MCCTPNTTKALDMTLQDMAGHAWLSHAPAAADYCFYISWLGSVHLRGWEDFDLDTATPGDHIVQVWLLQE